MFYRVIFLFVLITSSTCQDNLQKCGCSLININSIHQETVITDFSQEVPSNDMSKIELLQKCEIDCRQKISTFLTYPQIGNLNLTTFNLDDIPNAADKICPFINKDISRPGLKTFIKIENLIDKQSFSKIISIGSVCCNRPCSCILRSKFSIVKNFQSEILNQKNKGYKCNDELKICENECRILVSNYFGYEPIKNTTKVLVNIFQDKTSLGDLMCSKETSSIYKPGKEYFFSIETWNDLKNVYLGRVCCKRPCDCSLFKSESNSTSLFVNLNSNLPSTSSYYDCNNEETECLRDCRAAAGVFLKNQNINDLTVPVSSIDFFANFNLAADICQILNKPIDEPGVDIFLRYSTSANLNAKVKEDLKIGRICCKAFFESFLPSNRCGSIGLPSN